MGIRIKKVLGYAIKNIKYSKKKWCFTDDRINPDGYLGRNTDWETREEKWKPKRFLEYAKMHLDSFDYTWLELDYKENSFEFYDFIHDDMEYGIAGVIMIQPPIEGLNWYRNDDSIDYYEHSLKHNGAVNSIEFLDTPLYPFSGYINANTGERYTGRFANELWYHIRSRRGTKGKVFRNYSKLISAFVEKLQFKSLAEAKKTVVPMIPEVLVAMVRYLQIFNDDLTIWQLRPAIYTYWS